MSAAAACTGLTLTRFPLDGTNGVDWMIYNYTDRDATAGTADYFGKTGAAARTKNAHTGADVAIPTFRRMDDGTALVRAAAPGTVVDVVQTNFDRNTSCTGQANYIAIDHGNGFLGSYLHIKKNSARVQVGTQVSAGTVLAVVGSSGCSTGPHLHFELACGGAVIEPFKPNLWSSAPVYRPTSQVMETSIRAGGQPSLAQIEDPAPDATVLEPNSSFGVGVAAGVGPNDVIHVRLWRPDGTLFASTDRTVTPAHYVLDYQGFQFEIGSDAGEWKVEAQVNNGRTVRKAVRIAQVTLVQIAEPSIQSQFEALMNKGYRPIWVDTFSVGGSYYYNAVFRLSDGTPWFSKGALTAQQLTAEFAQLPSGYRPIALESYARGTVLNYSVIFAQQSGPAWNYYFGKTDAQAQTLFAQYVAAGHRQLTSSVSVLNGVRYNTALYDKSDAGGWTSRNALTFAEYSALFDQQVAAGRRQSYLDIDTLNGSLVYSALFDSRSVGGWQTRSAMSASSFAQQSIAAERGGQPTRLVRGYDVSGSATFAGTWSQLP